MVLELFTITNFVQACLLIFSGLAAYMLTSKKNKIRFFGCIIGLIGQIFWFWSSISTGAWGIFLLTIFYAIVYSRGIINNKPLKNGE